METFFLAAIVILGLLAVMDLTVGVSNDAVNFLNSAIGSKVASIKVILIVAAFGILIGSASSSGMMEIARKGIFHPYMFTYYEIMMLFLAVMFGDIILLDLFNTFGMPTSTTVSLIFGLLGSAVAVGSVKVWSGDAGGGISQFINSSQAMGIIMGILLSVVIAFVCGTIVMYLSRIVFTFNYKQKFKKYGSIWCGIVFTAITYFAVVKGLKGTHYEPTQFMEYITKNFWTAQAMIILFWTVLMFLFQRIFKVNILKISILAGTFALALAFAGNDLVNFIGVFMAGLTSYGVAGNDPTHIMTELSNPVTQAQTWILILAGMVMVVALFTSKKIGSVSKTEVNLARQDEGNERFGSSLVSRSVVRAAITFNKNISSWMPRRIQNFVASRFEPAEDDDSNSRSFDQIRATVNLTTAAILICIATSYKLPLSTTYVTFMVAMGTSLSDRAWGRESAVYRITGVLTVISGWFFTAFMAFTMAFVIALILMYGGYFGLGAMVLVIAFVIVQSNIIHRRRKAKEETKEQDEVAVHSTDIMKACAGDICDTLHEVVSIYSTTMEAIYNEDRKTLRNMMQDSYDLYEKAHNRKYKVYNTLHLLEENYVKTGHYYVQVVDYANEVTKALVHITKPSLEHIENNHQGFSQEQIEDLRMIENKVKVIYNMIEYILKNNDYSQLNATLTMRDSLFDDFAQIIKRQIYRIKNKETSTRSSMLYLDILNETKTMVLQVRNLIKAQNYFVQK